MAIISNTVQNNTNNRNETPVSRARTYRSGNSSIQLQEGQTLKGVVSDVHGNQITLSLDDGASFTGKLPDANQYSIGQKAAFQITSLDNNTIYMKAVSGAYLLDMEDTVDQALEEAGLPKSDRNADVVRSLLKNQQSISRENILSAIRLCAQYNDSDVDSVITMKRLNLPMTQDSVKQFSNYQNQTHQLLYKMDSLTDSVSNMMNSVGNQVPRLAGNVADELINLALDSQLSPAERELAEQSSDMFASVEEDVSEEINNTTTEENLSGSITNSDEEALASNAEETVKSTPLSKMRQLFNNISESVTETLSGSSEPSLEKSSFIHEQTGFILPKGARESLSHFLSDYPISDELKQGLSEGTATIRDVLKELQKNLPQMTEEQTSKLLTNKEFHSLVKNQFINNWTISPEQLKETGSMDELYQKMSQQFEQLSGFSERVLGKDVFSQLTNNASDMNSNLDFMKTMNETFQYIQLPLKLENQNTHGDLYVMTRKEALKKNPNKLKVLLHLDMDHLGTLDIQISKENTAVSANFFVSTEHTKNLLEKNIELLKDAINEQGYAFTSELALKEKDIDVVNDFIGADAPVGNITRYNFDLRA